MNISSPGAGAPSNYLPEHVSQKRSLHEENEIEEISPEEGDAQGSSKRSKLDEGSVNQLAQQTLAGGQSTSSSPNIERKRSRDKSVETAHPEEKSGTLKQAKLEKGDAKAAQLTQQQLTHNSSLSLKTEIENTVPKEKLFYSPEDFKRLLLIGHVFPPNVTVTGNLDLSRNTSLTSLPHGMRVEGYLNLDGCTNLTSLPEGLCVKGYLSLFRCTGLTTLPQRLEVGNNLSLHGCANLTWLPEGLRVVGFLNLNSCSALTSLPQDLQVRGNLDLGGCIGLISLPERLQLGGSLALCNCIRMRSLPSWITTLGPLPNGDIRQIDLTGTALSEVIINRLRQTPAPGIQFHFSQAASVPDKTFNTIDEALIFWIKATNDSTLIKPTVAIEQHLDNVVLFLSRLTTTAEYKNAQARPMLARRVIEAFTLMAQNDKIKARAVDLIYHGLASCDDRIISALDQIELMVRIHDIKNSNLAEEELKKLGRSFLLLDMINEKVAEFIQTLPYVDEIEIYLAFQIGLAARLNLPVKTRNMIFRRCAQVTDAQIAQFGNEIEKACTEEKVNAYLQTWSPWMEYQRRYVPPYESLPTITGEFLDDKCAITQDNPEKPVFYNNTVYDYDAFVQWYRASGKDPMNSGAQIDLRILQRIVL